MRAINEESVAGGSTVICMSIKVLNGIRKRAIARKPWPAITSLRSSCHARLFKLYSCSCSVCCCERWGTRTYYALFFYGIAAPRLASPEERYDPYPILILEPGILHSAASGFVSDYSAGAQLSRAKSRTSGANLSAKFA